jgi:hypothetical protein
MTTLVLKNFSGELPNVPDYKLPDINAQQALFCDFAQNDLRPLRGGTLIKTMVNTVRGIYTEEGTNFFTWPVETFAVKTPVNNDTYGRMYFMNSSGFKVAQYSLATATGGEPSTSYTVGVPAPTVSPTLVLKQRASLPDYPSISVTTTVWYELNGKRYQEGAMTSFVVVSPWKKYTFTPPARTLYNAGQEATSTFEQTEQNTITTVTEAVAATGTPPDAKLTAQIIIKDTTNANKEIFNVTVASGATTPTRSNAFPGGVEVMLSTDGALTFEWGVVETRAYVYTMVNAILEESVPSGANAVSLTYLDYVEVTTADPSFTGYIPKSTVNIYRTFGTNPTYFKITTTSLGSGVYKDETYKASDIGVPLPSLDWDIPETGMTGLVSMPNGFFAAYKNNMLYFSEPFRPHAWPYAMSFPNNIMGICTDAQSLVVTTNTGAYIVLGSLPSNLSQQKLPLPQAGIAQRLMVNLEGAVAYASADGIVLVQGSQSTMTLSQKFYSREDWRSTFATIADDARFGYTDGYLVMVSSQEAKGIIIRLDEAAGTLTQFNETFDSMFYLPITDTLYYSKGANVYRLRDGAAAYYTLDWWSKEFTMPNYTNFGAFYIRCTASTAVTIYVDGASWTTFTAAATGYYRLPAGKRALRWSVRVQTTGKIEEIAMAESMSEFRNV